MLNPSPTTRTGINWAIGLLSAAIIAFQLALIQIFSCQQWYHFAYMVISLALLGFGVAGTFLSLFEKRLVNNYRIAFPFLLFMSGMTMATVTGLSNVEAIRFDSYLLFNDAGHIWRLILTCLLFFLPFFLGALAIGMTFVRFSGQIGKLYFANLLGSGMGGILGLALMWQFFPTELPGVISVIPLSAGLFVFRWNQNLIHKSLFGLTVIVVGFILFHPPELKPSEYKALSKTLLLPEAKVELEKNSPYGLVQMVSSPVLRYAPGLSLNFRQTVPVRKALFHNGDWMGSLVPPPDSLTGMVLDFSTRAMPYAIGKPETVLVLNAGSGEDMAHAMANVVPRIVGVEGNAGLLGLLTKDLATENDSLFYHSSVRFFEKEARTFLLTDTAHYDLIVLPMVGAFGGTSGLNALSEQYEMTLESFGDVWEKLTPDGGMVITSWLDYPLRAPLKILATLIEMLENQGIGQPIRHLAAIKNWGTITFFAKKELLSAGQTEDIRTFCRDMEFDPILLPDLIPSERNQFNQLRDSSFFETLDALFTNRRNTIYETYDFNIEPATDQKPYFSQFLRLKSLPSLSESFGGQSIPFLEIGYLLVLLTFGLLAVAAAVLIILPLFRLRFIAGNRRWILLYFSGIGIGYMFVEIVFIQQFILFFGNPVFAAAAVISCLLIASGAGSYFSARFRFWDKPLIYAPLFVAGSLIFYAFILPPFLQFAIGISGWLKFTAMVVAIAPLGFLMGIPFPSAIRFLENQKTGAIPWAWGINGYFSVISTALATIIAVEWGFWWVMVLSGVAYALAGGGSVGVKR